MKQDIKNNECRERQKYASPSVKVINVTAQRIICGSEVEVYIDDDIDGLKVWDDDSANW